jgi:hypothetical protein
VVFFDFEIERMKIIGFGPTIFADYMLKGKAIFLNPNTQKRN